MNIAQRIDQNAVSIGERKAVSAYSDKKETYVSLTHRELFERVNQFAHQLKRMGVRKGSKVLLFVRPGLDFPCLVFALFKLGAVPVMMDPGMGLKNLLSSIVQVKPDVLLAEPVLSILRLIFFRKFRSVKIYISFGPSLFFAKNVLKNLDKRDKVFLAEPCSSKDLAAILFTSGGTGIPKGVEYTHEIFSCQTDLLKEMFDLSPREVDLACFPLFSLFTIAIGMNACFPVMNFSKPAQVNPKHIVDNINVNKVTFAAGSPAIWDKVANYCLEHEIELESIKYLVMFGAPISVDLHRRLLKILPNGNTFTPYGATECLPVSCIDGKSILKNTAKLSEKGAGTCVGHPVSSAYIKILPIIDGPIENLSDVDELAFGHIGEICVHGPMVTPSYYQMPEKTKQAKMLDEDHLWHRMGDVGYIDANGLLWFCGRKSHRVEFSEGVRFSIPVESFFNQHPLIKRSALIKIKDGKGHRPALVVERRDGKINSDESFRKELLSLAKKNKETAVIEDFFCHRDFPVDGRHNIKIDRLALGLWAQRRAAQGKIKRG